MRLVGERKRRRGWLVRYLWREKHLSVVIHNAVQECPVWVDLTAPVVLQLRSEVFKVMVSLGSTQT